MYHILIYDTEIGEVGRRYDCGIKMPHAIAWGGCVQRGSEDSASVSATTGRSCRLKKQDALRTRALCISSVIRVLNSR